MKAKIFGLLLGVALLAVIGWRVNLVISANQKVEEKPVEAALIRTARVVRSDLTERVAFTGTIRPRNEVDVFAKVPGRVEALLVKVGDKVRLGQTLAVVEHKEIGWQQKTALAAVELAKVGVTGAEQDYARTAELFKSGAVAKAQMDGVELKLAMSKAQLMQAEAAAGLAAQSVANATITAPISGTVTRCPINLGMQVSQVQPIFTLQDVATLKLEGAVDSTAYSRLQKGAVAEVTVDTLDNQTFAGKVTVIAPTLDAVSRRAAVEIEVDNSQGKLMPNMFARAEVVVGQLQNALAVPRTGVFEAAGAPVVYRVVGGKVEALKPKLGVGDRSLLAVLSDLQEGDEVAISGLATLSDGAPVKVASGEPAASTKRAN